MTALTQLAAVSGVPDITSGDDLAAILGDCLVEDGGLERGDILCLAHKVVSKCEGNVIDLDSVTPSEEALVIARKLNKRPEKVEVILRQSTRVVRQFRRPSQNEGVMICEHRLGHISANAAVDESNTEPGTVVTLPDDPDASAKRLGKALESRFGVHIGVVVTDTFGRPWRLGQVNVAIGLHRVPAKVSLVGGVDAWGRTLAVTEPALADELAAASGLVIGKASKTPLVRIRGVNWNPVDDSRARDILRASEEDMFR
ncbi:MAG: coenzyme F420-0:L-glutamate ligase [Pseudomonadota bacterium]